MVRRPILVVDDTPEIRDLIADILTDEGYPVTCASNGSEALAIVERITPALVLLDLNMPVLDGRGFARALTDRSLSIPILLLTAAGDAARCAQELGAIGLVAKPFTLGDLLAAVGRAYPMAME
jgi:two-component system chemotaxis response regulator CheY